MSAPNPPMYQKPEERKPVAPESDAQKIKRLEDERDSLRERVAFLERGVFVIERAVEYRNRFEAYEEQIVRLSVALEKVRRGSR